MTPSTRVLITAGPTHEPIDRVRYVANRSSGRMGIALAADAVARDWSTTLLVGPVAVPPDADGALRTATIVRFRTAADLSRLLDVEWPRHDLLIMAAAVADWRPAAPVAGKLRRHGSAPPMIALEAVPDLLAGLAPITRPDQVVVGFALEPADILVESARDKLQRKRIDAIVANPLETMDADGIDGTLIHADGTMERPESAGPTASMAKRDFAHWLLDRCAALLATRRR